MTHACLILLCLSNVYIEGAIGYVKPPTWNTTTTYKTYDVNHAANPRGRIAVGQEWAPSPKVRVAFELRHESWIGTTKDHGMNSAWVSARVYPWRRQP